MTPPDRPFRHHYDTLRRIARELQQQQEPDLDALIPRVDEAMRAYAACRARIEAVERLLAERLPAQPEAQGDSENAPEAPDRLSDM